jgi:lysophospholipase L1-like esterase
VTETWVEKFINRFPEHTIYTYLSYGLSSKSINPAYIKRIAPDYIIAQVGIVDCCRRALPRWLLQVLSSIPVVDRITHKIAQKYHYQLSRFFHAYDVNPHDFKQNISRLCEVAHEQNAKMSLISIADAGKALAEKVYNCQADIDAYNKILKDVASQTAIVLYPYIGCEPSTYLLESDGYHLTKKGHDIVFNEVSKWLINELSE